MEKPVADVIDYRRNKCQQRCGYYVVTHNRINQSAAKKADSQQEKSVEACTRGKDIPKQTREKPEYHAPDIALKHTYADRKWYK